MTSKKFFTFTFYLFCISGLCGVADGALQVQVEPASPTPALLEDTTLNIILKNTGKETIQLPDRFSGRAQSEVFKISVKDKDGKYIAASNCVPASYPREDAGKTIEPNGEISVPVTIGELLYDERVPARHLLPIVSADQNYYVSVSYTNRDEATGNITGWHESEPIVIKFKQREIPGYKVVKDFVLSDPKDLSVPFPTDDPSDGLLISVETENNTPVSKDKDTIKVTFENKWDKPVVLCKLLPDENTPNSCSLSFILCRMDGTPIVNSTRTLNTKYDAKHDFPIKNGDKQTVTIGLSQFIPASVFEKPGEYYLMAKYDNQTGTPCLRGVWYSQPVKISIAKTEE